MQHLIHSLFQLSLMLVLFAACTQSEEIVSEQQKVISPKGVVIAESMEEFSKALAGELFKSESEKNSFEITNIDFKESEMETAILVDYETTSIKNGNIVLVFGTSNKMRVSSEGVAIICNARNDCTTCQVETINNYGPDGSVKSITFTCSCDSCSMTTKLTSIGSD